MRKTHQSSEAPTGNIVEYLKRQQANKYLTESECYFLEWLIDNINSLSWRESISSISKKCSFSQSSITKFFNKIGINGYKGFCMQIANIKNQANIEDPYVKSLTKTMLALTKKQISDDLEKLIKVIVAKQSVSLIATGFSYIAAMKLQRQLRVINIKVNLYDSMDELLINDDESVKVFISATGKSKSLDRAFGWVKKFKSNQMIFALTSGYCCSIKNQVDGHIYGYVVTDKVQMVNDEHSLLKWAILNYCLDQVFMGVQTALATKNSNH